MGIELSEEMSTMNRLIDFCLEKQFEKERIEQLLSDWRGVSGNLIPEEIFKQQLKRKFGGRNERKRNDKTS